MNKLPPRMTKPHRWRSTALTGAAVGLAVSTTALADAPRLQDLTAGTERSQIWLAQAEGGEGGEAGAVADVSPEIAYLARLSIVEGHLAAAALMYRKGLVDDAVGLSYHPEAEMMDEVRDMLAKHGAPDISPAMTAFSDTMQRGASPDEVDLAMRAVSDAVTAASSLLPAGLRQRLDAVVVLLQAAQHEYSESTKGGVVNDSTPYYESYGFVAVAKSLAAGMAADADPKTAAAGAKTMVALTAADAAFGDLAKVDPVARDPAILLAVTASVELIAGSVR